MKMPKREDCILNGKCKQNDAMCPLECGQYVRKGIISNFFKKVQAKLRLREEFKASYDLGYKSDHNGVEAPTWDYVHWLETKIFNMNKKIGEKK